MKSSTTNQFLEPLLNDCRNLLRAILKTHIKHVYKEANQYVDALAKLGYNLDSTFVLFDYPLFVVKKLLALDRAANICNRLIILISLVYWPLLLN